MAGSMWVKVFPPGDPVDLSAPAWDVATVVGIGNGIRVSWPAAVGAASYEVSIDGVAQNVGDVLTFDKTGLTVGQSYACRVRPVSDALVEGAWSAEKSATAISPFNAATGGTETTITDYNGTGQTWKVHTFNAGGTFEVLTSVLPFQILACGGGGGGGGSNNAVHGGAGGGGRVGHGPMTVAVGSHAVVVGTGGPGGGGNGSGTNGNPSSVAGVVGTGGAASGANAGGTSGAGGGANLTNNISGANVLYGADAPVFNAGGGAGGAPPGGGGGPAAVGTNGGGTGQTGRVVIAYRIG
jgi:hypothetical protein